MLQQEQTHYSVNQIKVWLFPTLLVVLGTIIWNDLKEIKSDVKLLMAQSNIDKTRIDNIEKQLSLFKGSALLSESPSIASLSYPTAPGKPFSTEFIVKDLYVDTRQKKILTAYVKQSQNTTL